MAVLPPTKARPNSPLRAGAWGRSCEAIKFFTIPEVAERLDVTTRTDRRWIKRGELVAHRFGGVVRIAEADLRAFFSQHRDI